MTGMHKHPLLTHVPLMTVPSNFVMECGEGELVVDDSFMTDYAIQIQAIGAAARWLDVEDGWDGPKYLREKSWLIDMLEQGFLPDQMTGSSEKTYFTN
ncbi:hypothetical protein E1B28_006978 [Marasmius oreades]|uniref:Uncharacterized protein n=1 Tax=Marasmius oreades TaxID=181124 RepID=A0A9P7S0R1_9AGAR|nr:uncharacterized protein E1B28_006978 [Marasmius oreades]KAG7093296.1 hypothetical protein E1B28_006978 [Marasmius oreades]